jgi:hypothetical protein
MENYGGSPTYQTVLATGEPALRGNAESLKPGVLGRLVDPRADAGDRFQGGGLARHQAEDDLLVLGRLARILPVTVKGLCQIQSSVAFLKCTGAPSIGATPSISLTIWSRKENRRNSPSVTTSRPMLSCIAMAWSTARSSTRLNSGVVSWPAAL